MDRMAPDLQTMIRTPLHDDHVRAMRRVGEEKAFEPGDLISELGAPITTFYYVVEGEVEAIEARTGGRYGNGSRGPTQFFGEISFLNGGNAVMSARVVQPSRLLCVPREEMLRLMSDIPEMSDIIVTVFAARRRRLLESGAASLTLIGAEVDRDIRRIAAFAGRNRIPFRSLSLDEHEAEALRSYIQTV